jgi:TetR/AcrR family transcriptional repressor of nem operon
MRFREVCSRRLLEIDSVAKSPAAKLRGYVDLFRSTLADDGRMCLCGMLAAGVENLPDEMREDLREAILEHEQWLAKVFREGRRGGIFPRRGTIDQQSRAFLAALEGSMLLARVCGGVDRFEVVAAGLLNALASPRRSS